MNASHGAPGERTQRIRTIREAASQLGRGVWPGILLDLQGPKIRLGKFKHGKATLKAGQQFRITTESNIAGDEALASTTYGAFAKDVVAGSRVLLADGAVELRALSSDGRQVTFEVINGGVIGDNKGINLPGVALSIPSMTEKDRADLELGISNGVDFVALSFVRSANDVLELRKILQRLNSRVPIIAKIEKPDAVEHLDAILDASDGVMVARGDLGVEMALARVPGIQKTIIERARMRGRFVITATQMLESMIEHPAPTRAEVNDVANAIFDGTDAVMLSGETAAGAYPIESVRMMAQIAEEAEAYVKQRRYAEPPLPAQPSHAQIIAEAAYHAGLTASVKAIAAFTSSGSTARMIALYRPHTPIFAFCESQATARSLSVIYGVHATAPVSVHSFEDMQMACEMKLLGEAQMGEARVRIGDNVILVGGAPFGTPGSSNMLQLHRVGGVGIQRSLE